MKDKTPKEAAEILEVTQSRIRQYLRAGRFPGAHKKRGTRWLIPIKDILALGRGEI